MTGGKGKEDPRSPGFLPEAVGLGRLQGEGLQEEAEMTGWVFLRYPETQPGPRPGLEAKMAWSALGTEVEAS